MDKKEILMNLEKESIVEINNLKVSSSDLEKCGVSAKTLKIEEYLHNIYGDEILKQKIEDNVEGSSKIAKLSGSEIEEDKEFRNICSDIENSEFDKNIDLILK